MKKYSLLPLGASFCSLYVFFSFEGIPIAFPGVVIADFLHTEIVIGAWGEEPLSMVVDIHFFSLLAAVKHQSAMTGRLRSCLKTYQMTEAEPGSWAGTLSFVLLLLSQQVVEIDCFKHSYIAGEDELIACLLLDAMLWNYLN